MNGTLQVRKTSSGIKQVLLKKCQETEASLLSKKCHCAHEDALIDLTDLFFHGMTDGGIVLGQVQFSYIACKHICFHDCATAFAIELDKIFELDEPAASFAAISFPLDEDLLMKKDNVSGYCPYYKSFEGGVSLTGLVSLGGKFQVESARVHSFETVLERGSPLN